jgi:hypothetical protein
VAGDQPLVHQVEGVEAQVVLADVERSGGLARWQPLQLDGNGCATSAVRQHPRVRLPLLAGVALAVSAPLAPT